MNKYLVYIESKENNDFNFFLHGNGMFSRIKDFNNYDNDVSVEMLFDLFSTRPSSLYFEGKNIAEVRKKVKKAFNEFKADGLELTEEEIKFLNSNDVVIHIFKINTTCYSI